MLGGTSCLHFPDCTLVCGHGHKRLILLMRHTYFRLKLWPECWLSSRSWPPIACPCWRSTGQPPMVCPCQRSTWWPKSQCHNVSVLMPGADLVSYNIMSSATPTPEADTRIHPYSDHSGNVHAGGLTCSVPKFWKGHCCLPTQTFKSHQVCCFHYWCCCRQHADKG